MIRDDTNDINQEVLNKININLFILRTSYELSMTIELKDCCELDKENLSKEIFLLLSKFLPFPLEC